MTIAELEHILQHDDEIELTILPNGQVVSKDATVDTGEFKPVTFRESLGGEYSF